MQARYPHSFCYNKHIIVYPDIKGKKKERERENRRELQNEAKNRVKEDLTVLPWRKRERDAVNRIAQKYSKSMRRSRG